MPSPSTLAPRGYSYLGCLIERERLPETILVATREVNRYSRNVWRVTFPDGTWIRIGRIKGPFGAHRYIDQHIHQHQAHDGTRSITRDHYTYSQE